MNIAENMSILVLPGMDGTGELLKPLVDRLSLRHQVQLTSYPVDRPLGYDDLVAFVLERAPKGPFIIVAESFSGPIAIEIAARECRVTGLVLASSFARHPVPKLFAAFAHKLDLKFVPNSLILSLMLGSTGSPEIRAQICGILERLPRSIIRARAVEACQVDKLKSLSEVKCPMLCLHGRFDHLVGKLCVDEIVAVKPGCQVRWLEASHMLLETHTDAAADAINEFCGQLSKI